MLTHAVVALPCLGDRGCLSQERPFKNNGSGTCGTRHNTAAGQPRPLAISLPVQPAEPQHLLWIYAEDQFPLTSKPPISEESRGSRKAGLIRGYLFPSSRSAKRRSSALSILGLPCRTIAHDCQQHSALPSGSDRAAPALHWPSKSLWSTKLCVTQAVLGTTPQVLSCSGCWC